MLATIENTQQQLEGETNNIQNDPSQHNASSNNAMDHQSSKGMRTPKSKRSKSRLFKKKLQERSEEVESLEQSEKIISLSFWEKIQYYVGKFIDNKYYTIIMTLITLYALFGDDIRVVTTEKDEDPYFWGVSSFALGAFILEILLSCIGKKGYAFSFYFWLDLLSTVSLILDIGWIANQIFDINSGGKGKASSAASLAKASRASRVGTRAGRIVRIVRLVRLVRLYKHAQEALRKQAKLFEEEQVRLRQQQQQEMRDRNDSRDSSSFNQYQSPSGGFVGSNINGVQASGLQNKAQTPSNEVLREPNLPVITMDMRGNSHTNRNRDKKHTITPDFLRQQSKKQSTFVQVQRQPSQTGNKIMPFSVAQDIIQNQHDNQNGNNNNNNNANPVLNVGRNRIESEPDNRDRERSISSSHQVRSRNASNAHSQKSNGSKDSSQRSFNLSKLPDTETKVGKKLSERITQRVIVIVLAVLVSLPIFNLNTYVTPNDSFAPSLQLIINSQNQSTGFFSNTVQNFIDFHKNLFSPLVQLDIANTEYFPLDPNAVNYQNMRDDDITYYTYSDDSGNVLITAVASLRQTNVINAGLSIARTVFVAVILTYYAVQFNNDVELFILEPIEQMLKKVTRIAENPLEAAQMEEKEEFAIEQLKAEGKTKELDEIEKKSKYETVVLEKLIIRIGALLALGFGEAGSEIIAQNMKLGGDVDPMLPGKKMMAVFGFCDIRNFTDATEVLQTGVMIFVNEIAQITHGVVDQFCGQANKNIGDAFLLVWKFREQDYLKHHDGSVEFLPNDITSNYADLSVIAFLKIMAGITLSNSLKKYKHHAGLKARLRGYRVKMGFGLHFGWAIEGAIGSAFKIDASYLSPNVNMASRLEAATKQFGTGLLISGPLRNILSEKCQRQLRHIDCVTVKGSLVPLDLYTCDVSLERLYAKRKGKDFFDLSNFTYQQIKKKKILDRMKRNTFKAEVFKGTTRVADLFEKDPDLVEMRKEYHKDFYAVWDKVLQTYLEGRWFETSNYLKQTLSWFRDRHDGPSQTILEFIKEHNYQSPKDWKGFRVLTEK